MASQLNLNTEKIEKIKTQVQNINDTANAQATTISEIASLLEGKSVPGGGEDVTAETNTYTELLTDLEAAVDALPDAGGGSGGSGNIKAIEGVFTYTSEMSSPINYNYTLTSDELIIDEKILIIIYAEETLYNIITETYETVKNIVCYINRTSVDEEYNTEICNISITLTSPYSVTIENNNIILYELTMKSDENYTFNNFCYYAI